MDRARELAASRFMQPGNTERLGQDSGAATRQALDKIALQVETGDHERAARQLRLPRGTLEIGRAHV